MADERENMEEIDVETITIPMADGTEQEFAIWEDFDFEGQTYLAVSPINDNVIGDDIYIYRYTEDEEDIVIEYIDDEEEYMRIAEAYAAMCDETVDED